MVNQHMHLKHVGKFRLKKIKGIEDSCYIIVLLCESDFEIVKINFTIDLLKKSKFQV